MKCTLCKIEGEVVYEDAGAYVVLHDDWAVKGHAMVVAKTHVENVADLDEREWLHIARVWRRVEGELLRLTNADRCIVMKLGIMTPHLHLHLYPVSATASRDDVFAAIDAKTRVDRDEHFVAQLRAALDTR